MNFKIEIEVGSAMLADVIQVLTDKRVMILGVSPVATSASFPVVKQKITHRELKGRESMNSDLDYPFVEPQPSRRRGEDTTTKVERAVIRIVMANPGLTSLELQRTKEIEVEMNEIGFKANSLTPTLYRLGMRGILRRTAGKWTVKHNVAPDAKS